MFADTLDRCENFRLHEIFALSVTRCRELSVVHGSSCVEEHTHYLNQHRLRWEVRRGECSSVEVDSLGLFVEDDTVLALAQCLC